MTGGDISLIELFQEECRAHTAALNAGLLELEADPANPQRIEPLMRGAHSIKGAARIVGIDLAVQLAHVMEDVFVAAGEGRIRITAADIDELLRGTDLLAELSTVTESTAKDWAARHAEEVAALRSRLDGVARGVPIVKESATPRGVAAATSPPQVTVQDSAAPGSKPPVDFAWVSLNVPPEPILAGDDAPLFDLFREEIRAAAVTIDHAFSVDTALAIEPLIAAARAVRGAARIVRVDAAATLATALEDLFAAAEKKSALLDAQARQSIHRAIQILLELIARGPETVADWVNQHGATCGEISEQLAIARTAASRATEPEPAKTSAAASADQPAPTLAQRVTPVVEATPAEAPQTKSEQPATPAATATPAAADPAAVVRVTAQSLNRLMGLAGESLVQARWLQPFSTSLLKLKKHQDHLAGLLDSLSQSLPNLTAVDEIAPTLDEVRRRTTQCRQVLAERMIEFDDHAAQAEDLNTRLYREVIVSRMRPFSDGAHGFPRLVRDMARQLDKQVRLEIEGAETEVDRDVLEKLEAPLTHLLRNAVDHGIETAANRKAAGKSESGLIKLSVHHRAGMLAITISDDGAGIDPERIRRKVVERNLTTAEMAAPMTTAEVLEFLFLPGFSTAPKLTEYSGRGVGLDVVQQSVRRIGGAVQITSRPGAGTTFHLQLPITLSVLRAVLVDIDGEPYAFPHNRIDRLICVPASELRSLENRQYLVVDGENVGVVLTSQILGLSKTVPQTDELTVVLVSDSVGHYGLIVDVFRCEQDLVVRPLDARMGKVPNISAAAVLDNGSPVLIADVEDLIRSMDQYIQRGALQRFKQEDTVRGPSKRVLVVDDSITVREVERQILRNQGYDVTVAVDGQDGWNMVRSEEFDLVISDVDMPRMNGLEFVKLIRSEPAFTRLPVIIVSYKERQDDRMRGLEVGANYYLTKSSFHDDTFLQAVRDCIGEA